MERTGAVVIGAGAIGLAVARALSSSGVPCIVLERNARCGQETSSRSSEVLHAGLYYGSNSLKTWACLRGRGMLETYMKSNGIRFSKCGKLVVATTDCEVAQLRSLFETGRRNGCELEIWSAEKVSAEEPQVVAKEAIWSPQTGVFDTHEVIERFQGEIGDEGSSIVTNCEFISASRCSNSEFIVETSLGVVRSNWLINAAGLSSEWVASKVEGVHPDTIPRLHFAKGNYFKLHSREPPFRHLIYPLPVAGGLGIHSTLDLEGNVRFGPDVDWNCALATLSNSPPTFNYEVSEERKASFIDCIRSYWPAVAQFKECIHPDYAGVRPKLTPPGNSAPADFQLQLPEHHGVPGLVQLFGIESPGWTSAMAIAELVSNHVCSENSKNDFH